jgi:hypothetical protein
MEVEAFRRCLDRLGCGPGFQPRRRRILRTAVSPRPSRPAIHRLLLSLAFKRRMVRSRSEIFADRGERAGGRAGGRASLGSHQSPQSPRLETLLKAAKSSRGVAERASDIVLIGVSRFEKRDHGVGFGGAILGGVMGKDDAMDQDHSLTSLGLDANVRVHHGAPRKGSRNRQKFWLLGRRIHSGLACQSSR